VKLYALLAPHLGNSGEHNNARAAADLTSPHYFYPTDDGWKMNGPLEVDEFRTHTFARKGPLTLTGFANSGAD